MLNLSRSLETWGTPDFEMAFKDEVEKIESTLLPLQDGLSQSSYVSDSDIGVIILNITESEHHIQVKAGVYFAGIIAGSCCADDPAPVSEQAEYCELQFAINKLTAETTVSLLDN